MQGTEGRVTVSSHNLEPQMRVNSRLGHEHEHWWLGDGTQASFEKGSGIPDGSCSDLVIGEINSIAATRVDQHTVVVLSKDFEDQDEVRMPACVWLLGTVDLPL